MFSAYCTDPKSAGIDHFHLQLHRDNQVVDEYSTSTGIPNDRIRALVQRWKVKHGIDDAGADQLVIQITKLRNKRRRQCR